MLAGRRSLNLSNAAAIAVYEAWRQHGYPGPSSLMVATRFARLRRPRDRHGYQLFQCVRLSAGSRLAGRKSVPLV